MLDRISVHHIAFPTHDIVALGRHFAATGTRRVTLWSGLVEANGLDAVRAMVADGGYAVETMPHVFRAGALSPHIADMAADRARLSQAIRNAAALGARSIYMLTGGRGDMTWRQAVDAFSAAIAPCVAEAEAAGVGLSIETTTPFYAHLHLGTNLRDAVALVEQAGIGLCLDHFACWTESDVEETIVRALPRILLVQVSDYVLGDTSLPCRAVPGDGAIPWARTLRCLHEAGYVGNFDLELLGPRIEAEGPEQAVARAIGRLGTMLSEAGF